MQTLKEKVTAEVTARLEEQDVSPEDISRAVDEAEYAIRNYCGRWITESDGTLEALPEALHYAWVHIAMESYAGNVEFSADLKVATSDPVVKSLKVGDTTMDFGATPGGYDIIAAAGRYHGVLSQYRRLYPNMRD